MSDILAGSYVKDPTPLYKDLHVYGDELDALDTQLRDLTSERAKLMEARIPDRKKLGKVDAEIASVEKKLADKRAAIEKASKVGLKPQSKGETKPG
jgi:chorismate mutase